MIVYIVHRGFRVSKYQSISFCFHNNLIREAENRVQKLNKVA